MLEHFRYLKSKLTGHFIAASLRGVGMDLRSGWTQSFHTKIQQAQLLQHSSPGANQPGCGECCTACGGVGGRTGHGMREWEDGEETGRVAPVLVGKAAIQGFRFWSQQPLLTSSSLVSAMWFCSWACPCSTR